ncbi:hypothetical protein BD324DRAFT_525488 [Kockovaella imperatae]|uniref:LIM zinc-binding domain-containing protein n=1 Tax=Kockovaella imperatae TaxID=4999 RepID=A0A1Y1UF48_9TREE|nr:hypothetical protein BD324DRAFT_525488 [Kockovaella imperatae]ORX36126.1 hypothetical protein BD324DRAFT_525488 [Kockovaella imperatae]
MFGAAPPCTTCGKSVYHVEQVFGPGKKVYHKPCLKCKQCNKRLDPGGLVDHDLDPYCKHCHLQLFGTRDLRHSNLHPASPASTPSKTPARRPLPTTPSNTTAMSPMSPKHPTPRNLPPPADYYTPPQLSSSSVPATPDYPRDPCTPITRPNFQDARPISVPYSGKRENLDERGLLRRGDSPRIKVGEKVNMGDEFCWGCEKRVYIAEQVREPLLDMTDEQIFALGHK